ncbi:hypothetical protein [uncultured Roseobacter sp.]|uniref:hypothetical protein n=1 Tax=uncultured Roseobacter sp. TaxID=114847 RepID=UPI00261C2F22|nr:hypothetical protein [uncultured Roseobacter sp.]
MKSTFSSTLCLLAVMACPTSASAFDQNHFLLLVQEYQKHCSRMINAPDAFHQDPRASFGIQGEEEFHHTEDFANVDYYVSTKLQQGGVERSHGIVSVRGGGLIEQSCQVIDYRSAPISSGQMDGLAEQIEQIFGASPDFTISGGRLSSEDLAGHFFAVTGLFSGQEIISQITLTDTELSIEHIHLSSTK